MSTGVPSAVNDTGVWQDQADEADAQEIRRHLVDDPPGICIECGDPLDIIASHSGAFAGRRAAPGLRRDRPDRRRRMTDARYRSMFATRQHHGSGDGFPACAPPASCRIVACRPRRPAMSICFHLRPVLSAGSHRRPRRSCRTAASGHRRRKEAGRASAGCRGSAARRRRHIGRHPRQALASAKCRSIRSGTGNSSAIAAMRSICRRSSSSASNCLMSDSSK